MRRLDEQIAPIQSYPPRDWGVNPDRKAFPVITSEAVPAVVKGLLTVTPMIAFIKGWGSFYIHAHGLAFEPFERHPMLGILNVFGVPEPPERDQHTSAR